MYNRGRSFCFFIWYKVDRLRDKYLAFHLFEYLSAFEFFYFKLILKQIVGTFFAFVVTQYFIGQKERIFQCMLITLDNVGDLFMILGVYFEDIDDRSGEYQYRDKDLNEGKGWT